MYHIISGCNHCQRPEHRYDPKTSVYKDLRHQRKYKNTEPVSIPDLAHLICRFQTCPEHFDHRMRMKPRLMACCRISVVVPRRSGDKRQ